MFLADKRAGEMPLKEDATMSSTSISGVEGAAAKAESVLKETHAMRLITRTLEKLREAPQPEPAALPQVVRNDAGVGNKVDMSA